MTKPYTWDVAVPCTPEVTCHKLGTWGEEMMAILGVTIMSPLVFYEIRWCQNCTQIPIWKVSPILPRVPAILFSLAGAMPISR